MNKNKTAVLLDQGWENCGQIWTVKRFNLAHPMGINYDNPYLLYFPFDCGSIDGAL